MPLLPPSYVKQAISPSRSNKMLQRKKDYCPTNACRNIPFNLVPGGKAKPWGLNCPACELAWMFLLSKDLRSDDSSHSGLPFEREGTADAFEKLGEEMIRCCSEKIFNKLNHRSLIWQVKTQISTSKLRMKQNKLCKLNTFKRAKFCNAFQM